MNATNDDKNDSEPVAAAVGPGVVLPPAMHSPTMSLHALMRRGFQHEQMKKFQGFQHDKSQDVNVQDDKGQEENVHGAPGRRHEQARLRIMSSLEGFLRNVEDLMQDDMGAPGRQPPIRRWDSTHISLPDTNDLDHPGHATPQQ